MILPNYNNRIEFREKNADAYGAACDKKILDELFKNHPNQGYPEDIKISRFWTKEKLQDEVNKYENRNEFKIKDPKLYNIAIKNKLLDELFKNHKNQGKVKNKKIIGYWTKERLQDEVNKYKTRNEFKNMNYGAHIAAHKQKLLDELFKNHENQGYTRKEYIKSFENFTRNDIN